MLRFSFLTVLKSFTLFNPEYLFKLAVPIEKKRKNAQEEEEDQEYQPNSSDENESGEEEAEEEEEENEEDGYESESIEYDEDELPTTSKSLKDVAQASKVDRKKQMKRKVPAKPVHGGKKIRKTENEGPSKKPKRTSTGVKRNEDRKEKEAKPTAKSKAVDENDDDETKKDEKKEKRVVEYNDKNVDFNLYNEAPEHIKNVKIKLSSNILLQCRMIEASGNTTQGLTYDFASLSFVRQSKAKHPFEFNLPLSLAGNIIKGIKLIIKNNPKYFEKQLDCVNIDD